MNLWYDSWFHSISFSFQISYGVVAADDDSVNTVTSETESIQLLNLEPSTQYIITVTCVNAAGPGNTSSPVEIRTDARE